MSITQGAKSKINIQAETVLSKSLSASWAIVGFPGHGLVGSIAARHLIQTLNLEWVGSIRSPLIPPVSVFFEGSLTYPYRIYANEDQDVALLIGEAPVTPPGYFHIASAALDCLEAHGIKEIVTLDGFPKMTPDEKTIIYLVAEPELKDKFTDLNLEAPSTGYITGLSGAILNEALIRPIDGYGLLVNTIPHVPDPMGAAFLLKTLEKMKGLEIDTSQLEVEGAKIQKMLQEFADQTQKASREMMEPTYLDSGLYM